MSTIVVVGYSKLNEQITKLSSYYPGISFDMLDVSLDEVVDVVRQYYAKDNNCVFISAGANAQIISENMDVPFVEINSTGYDLLMTFSKILRISNKAAIVTFSEKLPYLSSLKHVFNIEYVERVYNDKEELLEIIAECKREGIHDIIGGSMVCEAAEKHNLRGYLLWTEAAIHFTIDSAISIAKARRTAMANVQRLRTLLDFAHEGIIITDKKGTIELFNSKAEKIVGTNSKYAIGTNIANVIKNTHINEVIRRKKPELNQIQDLGKVKILTNRVPIIIENEVIGAITTFQRVDMVRKAEEKVRKSLFDKGFTAAMKFDKMIRASQVMENMIDAAKLYSQSEFTVVIKGENGTGKDLLAQSIHNHSSRKNKPFVAINCAALSSSLLESELFGYEEGAFTGALKGGKNGIFELAHTGTIFLDEIGEMPLNIQSRLLRVLEQKEIKRLGGETIIHVDVRVIAATNKNLYEMVMNGQFREDLYYRLNVLELKVPPLRKRYEDIPLLAESFLKDNRDDLKPEIVEDIKKAVAQVDYSWPGNVRELKNIIDRLSALYREGDDVAILIKQFLIQENDSQEKKAVIEALQKSSGSKTRTAEMLGISRTTLWRKMKEFGIEDKQ